ncbi:MAG: LemA family protein [Candidatus Micrarchaeota archaeon]
MFVLVLGALLVLIVLGAIFAIGVYNTLVTYRNRVENAWSQIDVQLKRRYDLIPNLVQTVKGYMKHEKTTLENVTKYRAQLVTGSVADKAKADGMLTQALKSLFAVSENYPKLVANESFKALQEELAGTENKIAYARQAYNDSVLQYDTYKETIPGSLLVGFGKFPEIEYFKAPQDEKIKKAPKVEFD